MSERLIQPYEIDIDRLLAKLKPDVVSWINQVGLDLSGITINFPTNVAYKDAEQTFTATQWIANNGWGGKILYGSAYYEPSEIGVTSGRLVLGNVNQEEHVLGSQAFSWTEDAGAGNQNLVVEGDNKRAVLRLKRSDGTFDAPSAIAAANEIMGGIFAEGYLTDTWPASSLASIQFVSGQAFTNSHGGTYIRINTTPIDSVTAASVVWIREDGKVGIGDSTPDSLLELGAASGAGYITLNEVSAPSSPAADKLALYAKDNGSGVTKLYTKDSAGAVMGLGGGDLTSSATTFDLLNATVTTLNLGGAATAIVMGASTGYVKVASNLFVNETANANQSHGITINQGSALDSILEFKNSNVSHGMTALVEDDSYGVFGIAEGSPNYGGIVMHGFSMSDRAFFFTGNVTSGNTTKSTSAKAPIEFRARKKSGTGITGMGANENLVQITNNGNVKFIFDADGDSHQDVGTAWTNFDAHDDIALLNHLSVAVSSLADPIHERFAGWLNESRAAIEALPGKPLVTFNKDGHHFVNWSRLSMLIVGAIRQQADRITKLEERLARYGIQ